MDTIFRNAEPKQEAESLPEAKTASTGSSTVEVPYTDYASEHSHPYVVEHFSLGDTWNDPNGGFPTEVSAIEDYIHEQIKNGDISNSLESVKKRLKEMEKVNNLKGDERTIVRVETLAAYVKFLMKKEDIKRQVRRYGSEY